MDLGLKGKKCLVTGGCNGLGSGITKELLKEGAKVTATTRHKDTGVEFKDKLLKFDKTFYGLKYVNPDWKPSKETLEQEKKDGFIGLAIYQDFHSRTSGLPTENHTIPMIDGGCGESSVTDIIEHLGYKYNSISWKDGIYTVEKAN